MTFEQFWIKIENRNQYINPVRKIHPTHPEYLDYWKGEKKKVIEGTWGKESGGYRYCPGTLYFYANFYIIIDTDKRQKTRIPVKPYIRTVEWIRAYNYLVAQGFSGWDTDDEYSCDEALVNDYLYESIKNSMDETRIERFKYIHNSKGERKKYKEPLLYVRELFSQPHHKALYFNASKNICEIGCLGKDTGLRMFDGSVKKVQDILIGDKLMGIDSTERIVTDTFSGQNIMYEVKSKYNEPYIVSDTHNLVNENKDNLLIEDALYSKHKALTATIEYPEKKLMWHPYLLGLWLGDGFKREKMICGAYDDIETLNWLKKHCDENEHIERYHITDYIGGLGSKLLWRFNWIDKRMKYKNNWFSLNLRNNKHIPNEYLINSLNNRLELLAGMIDSDGNYEANRFSITNIDLTLLKQFQELARSCGFRAVINKPSVSGISDSLKYQLRISGDIYKIPTKLNRKISITNQIRDTRPNTIKVTPIGNNTFYGIEVDKDNLLVLEDYTVTHNSRGGGKSYFTSMLLARELLIDGVKYYDPNYKPKITVAIGSEKADKSQDLAQKVKDGIDALAENAMVGVIGEFGDANYMVNPLYKNMVGEITPNNKENPYRHSYKVKNNGELVERGTKSQLYHFSYSVQKKNGSETAVGTRLNLSVIEESGVTPNVLEIHAANKSTLATDDDKFGVELYLATSGNMETVQGIKRIFENPKTYLCVEFDNFYEEGKGKIGFFLPAYMVDNNFIDNDGNTDIVKAKAHYQKLYEDQTAETINTFKMDKPINPSDMWISKAKSIFNKAQVQHRMRQLMLLKNQGREEHFRRFVELNWNNNKVEVTYIPPKDAIIIDGFYESQGSNATKNKKKDTDTHIIIYEEPEYGKDDLYFVSCDPYVVDDKESGESLGSIFILKNPKYISEGKTGNIIVAELTGKPDSRIDFYSKLELLLAFYGNPKRSLMFEGNRGYDLIVEFFKKKGKESLLAFAPGNLGDKWKTTIAQRYGYIVGQNKLELLNKLKDWLEESTTLNVDGTKLNIERINSLGLLSELLNYDYEDDKNKKSNYDRIMSMLGCIVALRNNVNQYEEKILNTDDNIYSAFKNKKLKYKTKSKAWITS